MAKCLILKGVREYCEERDVALIFTNLYTSIRGINEGGYNSTEIDLIDLLKFLMRENIIILHKDFLDNLNKLQDRAIEE